jgi:predicted metal-dependent enzyme (double-stranded beta helix superfamily)
MFAANVIGRDALPRHDGRMIQETWHVHIANPAQALAPARFHYRLTALLDQRPDEARILDEGGSLLAKLVARDDWLPDAYAQPHPEYYQQMLLHCDSAERFSIVSFVWGRASARPSTITPYGG